MDLEINLVATPFLRWAGGKKWFLNHLSNFLPKDFNDYYEPFLGGGAVFFKINDKKRKYFLSDLNPDLINAYDAVQNNVEDVINELKNFTNEEEAYYHIRSKSFIDPSKKAAQFIYLNKTSFNGIYRVNQQGVYNVPFGKKYNTDFINSKCLIAANHSLQDAVLKVQDFEETLKEVKKGDLVFVDPPYTVAHENNGFIAYNQKWFSLEDQVRLSKRLKEINDLGAYFIMTNAKHEAIREIYSILGQPHEVQRRSVVGGKSATRGMITEYIFTNIKKI